MALLLNNRCPELQTQDSSTLLFEYSKDSEGQPTTHNQLGAG